MTRRRPGLTDEDARLWHQVTATVRPLDHAVGSGSRVRREPSNPEEAARGSDPGPDPGASLPRPTRSSTVRSLGDGAFARLPGSPGAGSGSPRDPATQGSLGSLDAGELTQMDARTARRLRRGRLPIDARLDLHGMSQSHARQALAGFLRRGQGVGWRCVLVITGKGRRGAADDEPWSGRGGGVLRQAVPRWLNEADLRGLVVGFTSAQPPDGGDGALYVMLRRRREGG